ncbi:hypothetical protein EVAR_57061_1 [Eumeta japonica]|uniref:Uncharacterized protein n=1 Tax=Eumeta variegata TaxID=151549 RepID=A0A4C1YN55_EUMVA|nr:hypothetical protein EVAR_57061_1 [Eumeta japonica]
MARCRVNLVLEATTQSHLPDLSGRDVHAAKSNTETENCKNWLFNILSDSRSPLEVLTWPKTYHPLAHETRRDLWAALIKNTAAGYNILLMSYAKNVFRTASLEKWQKRYVEGSTGTAENAKKIEERLKMGRMNLKASKSERKLLTVVLPELLKMNTKEDIVRSLMTQNKHIADGLNWEKERTKIGLQQLPVGDQFPLCSARTAWAFGHGNIATTCPTDSDVDVEEDQTYIDENVTATVIKAKNCRIGVVSVLRKGPAHRSVVDVTACSSTLLNRAEEWQVVRDLTSSDYNVVTFSVRMRRQSSS